MLFYYFILFHRFNIIFYTFIILLYFINDTFFMNIFLGKIFWYTNYEKNKNT